MHKPLWNFEIKMDHLILARWIDIVIVEKDKRTFRIVDFAVPAEYWLKLKENEKKDNYVDLAMELKKQQHWNMKVRVIQLVSGALGTVTKRLARGQEDLEIKGRVETI